MVLLGVYDDIRDLSSKIKLPLEVVCCGALYFVGFGSTIIMQPFGGALYIGGFAIVITALWIAGIMNAINFTDGLDGLAAGLVCICSLSIFPPEEGSVQISSINGVEVNGSEALLKGGTEYHIALTFNNKNGTLTQTVTLNAPAGASCKASATTEERNVKMGSAETRTFAALWIECQGAIAAGSDHSDDMEQVQ